MAQSRNLYKGILKSFFDSIKPRHFQYDLVGKDYLGTEYYESPLSPQKKRTKRWFTPVIADNFEQDIPPEWEAWLQHRRKHPPTEEEIQNNLAKARQAVENAKKLEKPPTISKDEIKNPEKVSFPKYDFDLEPDCKQKKKLQ